MYAKNCSMEDLKLAMIEVNKQYDNNIEFKRLEYRDIGIMFTLKVKDSKKPGHGLSYPYLTIDKKQRKLPTACWHVHGNFFECLFKINPKAMVKSSRTGDITKDKGNWDDYNIGSEVNTIYASELCECEL